MSLFSELYEEMFSPVFRFLYVRTRHNETSEDLAQEVFTRFLQKFQHIQDLTESKKICWGIAKRITLEWYGQQVLSAKKIQLEKARLTLFESPSEAWYNHQDMLKTKLRQAMSELPPKQREIALLFYKDGLSKQQIAEKLNVNRDHVKTYLKRATAFLKKHCTETIDTTQNTAIKSLIGSTLD